MEKINKTYLVVGLIIIIIVGICAFVLLSSSTQAVTIHNQTINITGDYNIEGNNTDTLIIKNHDGNAVYIINYAENNSVLNNNTNDSEINQAFSLSNSSQQIVNGYINNHNYYKYISNDTYYVEFDNWTIDYNITAHQPSDEEVEKLITQLLRD